MRREEQMSPDSPPLWHARDAKGKWPSEGPRNNADSPNDDLSVWTDTDTGCWWSLIAIMHKTVSTYMAKCDLLL